MDRLVWAVTSSFALGDRRVSVRSSSVEVDAMLRDVFGGATQPTTPDGEAPDYSFWLPDPAATGVRRLGTLFSGCDPVIRTRSVERLVRALHGQFRDLDRVTRDDIVAVEALAVVDPATTRAALLPRSARYNFDGLGRIVERRGLRMLDGMVVALSPSTGALIVEPGFTLDQGQRRRLAALGPAGEADEPVDGGSYPVSAWFRHVASTSRSSLLVQTLRRALRNGESVGMATAMEGIARSLRHAEIVPLKAVAPDGSPAALARAVAARLATPAP